MKTEHATVLGIGLVLVALAAVWEARAGAPKRLAPGAEITPERLKEGEQNQKLWLFYNDSDVNSRWWFDFGARSSRALNIPLLNLLYEKIAVQNGHTYTIEVITGLEGLAYRLGGWDQMPAPLRNPKVRVSTAEEDWIRACVLARWGGLWLSPSVIALKPFGKLPEDRIVAFGLDEDPLIGSAQRDAPGFKALWSPRPNHPMMVMWEAKCRDRLENQLAGRQIRGDAKSDWFELQGIAGPCEKRVREELGRDVRTGKKLELEDLLAAGTGGRLPFRIPEETVYIPIPYTDLLDRRMFGWILRSSEEQILQSDIAIRYLL
jgi:hypothetical protein